MNENKVEEMRNERKTNRKKGYNRKERKWKYTERKK
jgi:hypothetical protein